MAVGDFEMMGCDSKLTPWTTASAEDANTIAQRDASCFSPAALEERSAFGPFSISEDDELARQIGSILLDVLDEESSSSIGDKGDANALPFYKFTSSPGSSLSDSNEPYALLSRAPSEDCAIACNVLSAKSSLSPVVEQLVQLQLVESSGSASSSAPSGVQVSCQEDAVDPFLEHLKQSCSRKKLDPVPGGVAAAQANVWGNFESPVYHAHRSSLDSGICEEDSTLYQLNNNGNAVHSNYSYSHDPRGNFVRFVPPGFASPNVPPRPMLPKNHIVPPGLWTGMPMCYNTTTAGRQRWTSMATFPANSRPVNAARGKPIACGCSNGAVYILHLSIEECLGEFRILERERKKTEADLARNNLGKKISSANCLPIPRLPHSPAKIDRLIVDYFREHARVVTLLQKMEWLCAEQLNPRIINAIQTWFGCIRMTHICRLNERASLFYSTGMMCYDEDRQRHMSNLLRSLTRSSKQARSAMISALKMTLNKDKNGNHQLTLNNVQRNHKNAQMLPSGNCTDAKVEAPPVVENGDK